MPPRYTPLNYPNTPVFRLPESPVAQGVGIGLKLQESARDREMQQRQLMQQQQQFEQKLALEREQLYAQQQRQALEDQRQRMLVEQEATEARARVAAQREITQHLSQGGDMAAAIARGQAVAASLGGGKTAMELQGAMTQWMGGQMDRDLREGQLGLQADRDDAREARAASRAAAQDAETTKRFQVEQERLQAQSDKAAAQEQARIDQQQWQEMQRGVEEAEKALMAREKRISQLKEVDAKLDLKLIRKADMLSVLAGMAGNSAAMQASQAIAGASNDDDARRIVAGVKAGIADLIAGEQAAYAEALDAKERLASQFDKFAEAKGKVTRFSSRRTTPEKEQGAKQESAFTGRLSAAGQSAEPLYSMALGMGGAVPPSAISGAMGGPNLSMLPMSAPTEAPMMGAAPAGRMSVAESIRRRLRK